MNNYFIERNKDKKIIGLYARPQYDGQKFLPETHKEIVAFFKKANDERVPQEVMESKIRNKMRQMAIEALKADNELPSNFKG